MVLSTICCSWLSFKLFPTIIFSTWCQNFFPPCRSEEVLYGNFFLNFNFWKLLHLKELPIWDKAVIINIIDPENWEQIIQIFVKRTLSDVVESGSEAHKRLVSMQGFNLIYTLGTNSQKKECLLSGIAQIGCPPPHPPHPTTSPQFGQLGPPFSDVKDNVLLVLRRKKSTKGENDG